MVPIEARTHGLARSFSKSASFLWLIGDLLQHAAKVLSIIEAEQVPTTLVDQLPILGDIACYDQEPNDIASRRATESPSIRDGRINAKALE